MTFDRAVRVVAHAVGEFERIEIVGSLFDDAPGDSVTFLTRARPMAALPFIPARLRPMLVAGAGPVTVRLFATRGGF